MLFRSGAKHPLIVGDQLDTDIEDAIRGGADSMLVLTGVTSPKGAVLAPPGQRPTYVSADLGGLVEPQPVIGPRGGGGPYPAEDAGQAGDVAAACGGGREDDSPARAFRLAGWQVLCPGGANPIELSGDGAWIDGLRALCAAAWRAGHVSEDMIIPALKVLGDQR